MKIFVNNFFDFFQLDFIEVKCIWNDKYKDLINYYRINIVNNIITKLNNKFYQKYFIETKCTKKYLNMFVALVRYCIEKWQIIFFSDVKWKKTNS